MKHSVNIKKNRDYRFVTPWLGDGLLTRRVQYSKMFMLPAKKLLLTTTCIVSHQKNHFYIFSTGEKWHQRRKQLTPAFHFQVLKDFIPIFNRQVSVMIQTLRAKNHVNSKEAFDICPYITFCTLDIICGMLKIS